MPISCNWLVSIKDLIKGFLYRAKSVSRELSFKELVLVPLLGYSAQQAVNINGYFLDSIIGKIQPVRKVLVCV